MSKPTIEPYLTFSGRCEEALEFYKKAIGARVEMVMRFDEAPDPVPEGMLAPGFEKKIMHSSFWVGDSMIMASDGCNEASKFDGFSLSLSLTGEAEAEKIFAALGEGGKVNMPLGKTFWSPLFGMVEDRFGVSWMVNVLPKDGKGCA
ncbi:MAG TPA: VOC family protein [Chthoniobacterales bacterium]